MEEGTGTDYNQDIYIRFSVLIFCALQKKVTFFDQKKEKVCDVSDKNKWKVASMILQHFPGVVTEIRENK